MFGYTIVKKIYIKRLKEELELLYDLNQKLDKETGELLLRARKADQAVDMQLGKIVHLEQLNRELIETQETLVIAIEAQEPVIAALTGENEELKLQIKDLEAKSRW